MPRRTLIDFFADLSHIGGEFLVFDDGYRSWSYTYARRHRTRRARSRRACAPRASRRGPARRDLGRKPCRVDRRAVGLPARRRGPRPDRLPRLGRLPAARGRASSMPAPMLVGDAVAIAALGDGRPVWKLSELRAASDAAPVRAAKPTAPVERRSRRGRRGGNHFHVRRDGGAQGRRPHPPQHPREHRPDRARDREVPGVRAALPADPVPESAAAEPHVRAGDGDLRAADAPGRGRLHPQLRARRHRRADPRRGEFRCWCRCRRSWRCCASTCSGRAGGRDASAAGCTG